MSKPILDPSEQLTARLRGAIEDALPGAQVEVAATAPGHFAIRVVSPSFRGLSPVQQHRAVYSAIAPLMEGPSAPVHAIDRLQTSVPD